VLPERNSKKIQEAIAFSHVALITLFQMKNLSQWVILEKYNILQTHLFVLKAQTKQDKTLKELLQSPISKLNSLLTFIR